VGELLAIVAAARSGDRARLRGRAGLDAVRGRLDPDLADWLPA
jgi:hypothetical protein